MPQLWLIATIASTTILWLIAFMSERTPQTLDKYVLRMPDGMRDRIARSAKAHNRSMNAEIIGALESHYPQEPTLDDVVGHVEAMVRAYEKIGSPQMLNAIMSELERLPSIVEKWQSEETE